MLPLKTAIGLHLFRASRTIQTSLHELNFLFWECTNRCNCSCLHCGSDCTEKSVTPDMPLADFLLVLDSVSRAYDARKIMIGITGGEPLLRFDLEQCGEQIVKRGFPFGIVTNGTLLTENRFRSLRNAGLASVTISVDGLEKSHEWIRGRSNSFHAVCDAVERVAHESGLAYDIATCVNQRNVAELPKLRDFLLSLGVQYWRILLIFPKGRAAQNNELHLTSEQYVAVLDFIKETRLQNRIHITYDCEGFLGEYEGAVRGHYFFCASGITIAGVLNDGSITGCVSCRDEFVEGSIYKDDFVDCWENRFTKQRNRRWTKKGKCAHCEVYHFCNGNGLHLQSEQKDDPLLCHYEMIRNVRKK